MSPKLETLKPNPVQRTVHVLRMNIRTGPQPAGGQERTGHVGGRAHASGLNPETLNPEP